MGHCSKAESAVLWEVSLSVKTNDFTSLLKKRVCVWVVQAVGWRRTWGGNSQHNRLHTVSAPLWSANISVPHPTNHCAPSQQQPNKPGRRAQTHPFITERLPVTSSGSYPNQPSTPADNALWNPSPWELLHMLWVVVKATWLNNCPCSSLMRRLASPRLTHSFLWCENNRSERVLRIEGERGRAKCVLMVIILQTASF